MAEQEQKDQKAPSARTATLRRAVIGATLLFGREHRRIYPAITQPEQRRALRLMRWWTALPEDLRNRAIDGLQEG